MLPDGKVVPLTEEGRRAVLTQVNTMADDALRCLALAHKPCKEMGKLAEFDGDMRHPAAAQLRDPSSYSRVESDMVFLGLAGLQVGGRAGALCTRCGSMLLVACCVLLLRVQCLHVLQRQQWCWVVRGAVQLQQQPRAWCVLLPAGPPTC
jgi:hypothetical protein